MLTTKLFYTLFVQVSVERANHVRPSCNRGHDHDVVFWIVGND